MAIGEMRSAEIPFQERAGASIYNMLRSINDWAAKRGDDSSIQGLGVGQLVELMTSGIMDSAKQAASGTPNVYYDATSENPLNWQAKAPAADLALMMAPQGKSAALLGVKRIPKMWQGTVSVRAGKPSDISKILDEGFTKGSSAGMPGASMSRDPLVSLVGFTDRRDPYTATQQAFGSPDPRLTNPGQVLAVDVHAKPEDVYNLPPDFKLGGVRPAHREAMLNLPNFMHHEAETVARIHNKRRAPTASPRMPTDEEARFLEKEAALQDKQHSMYMDLMGRPGIDPNTFKPMGSPPARSYTSAADMGRKYVGAVASMKGNTGHFDDMIENIARNVSAGPYDRFGYPEAQARVKDAILSAAGPEGQYLQAAANMFRDARRYKEELIAQLSKEKYAGARAGIEPRESIDSVMARTGGDLSNVGHPGLRQAWRDDVKAKQAFFDELYNSVFKMRK